MEAEAKGLMEYMSALSEEAFCAAWMAGLEYALWQAVLEGRLKYGRLQLTRKHTTKLRELSDRCAGWIVFEHVAGECYVPLEQWQSKYEAERRRIV